jgi:hypothetical protein
VLIQAPNEVNTRLADLDVTAEELSEVVLQAYGHWADHTAFDPPSIPNTNLWGRATRAIREQLVPRGWDWDNKDQQPRTMHPSGRWAIVASSGDAATGTVHTPSTKNPKGDATFRKVRANQAQLDFPDMPAEVEDLDACVTWFLLIFVDEAEVRAELSMPAEINLSGFVTAWEVRIVLAPIPRGGDDDAVTPAVDDATYEVAVEQL